MTLNLDQAAKDMSGASTSFEQAAVSRTVGCIGFCMGGSLTLALAVASPDIAAVAPFYAGMQPSAGAAGA